MMKSCTVSIYAKMLQLSCSVCFVPITTPLHLDNLGCNPCIPSEHASALAMLSGMSTPVSLRMVYHQQSHHPAEYLFPQWLHVLILMCKAYAAMLQKLKICGYTFRQANI